MRPRVPALLFLALAAGLLLPAAAGLAASKTVAVTSIVRHPALDAVREGLRLGLSQTGHGPDLAIVDEDARGNPAIAAQIAERFVAAAPDVIVAISTPSAQAVVAATASLPIVFAAVTDPLAAGLVASLERPGGNVTGVSDMARVADNLALIRELTPGVRRLGFLFNPREVNSVASREALRRAAEPAGIEIVDAPVGRPEEVDAAMRALIGRVDAVFAPTDNTVVQDFEAAAAVAMDAKLPLYAADTENVARGALAAIGVDYHQIGLLTAALVARILDGEAPGDIPVVFASRVDLHLNMRTATAIDVAIPRPARDRAARVIE
jgi:putative tryptophan/tyrosine transport system substrate-binding protein